MLPDCLTTPWFKILLIGCSGHHFFRGIAAAEIGNWNMSSNQ